MPRVASLLCLISLGLLTACSSFDMRWMTKRPDVSANPAALAAGQWEGTWQSDATDYHGRVQALINYTTDSINDKLTVQQYTATFRMFWMEIPYDEFTVTLNATELADHRIHFEGKKDLGYFKGGIIHFDGFVYYPNTDEFYCDYASEKDAGTYKLQRIVLVNQ